jgi:serine protease AprX
VAPRPLSPKPPRPSRRLRVRAALVALVAFCLILPLASPAGAGGLLGGGARRSGDGGGLLNRTIGVVEGASLDTVEATGVYVPALDSGWIRRITTEIGAERLWRRGVTGAGVDVALIDTGVVPVRGLDDRAKVLVGPDLSFERQVGQLNGLDTYGHGTHLAGIIAGRDDGFSPLDAGLHFAGVAPDARIVSLKVGDHTGAVDVSQVIAAIDWVVQYGQQDGRNIRVINLSYRTDSDQPGDLDPLSRAVENAWEHGIVVVVAAGNDGDLLGRLGSPATNPRVIAVASSDADLAGALGADRASGFTSRGDGRSPDLAAPGGGVVSLRAPGSALDEAYPAARRATRFFRGSGTSQSAAVVSGAAALLLQQRPDLSPDQVKDLLVASASDFGADETLAGAGELDVWAASRRSASTPTAPARHSTGLGSLDRSRGTFRVLSPGGDVLRGEVTFTGGAFDSATWAEASAAGRAWSDPTWSGASWTSSAWSGSSWSNSSWSNSSWSGASWTNSSWSNSSWSGASWTNSSWSNSSWSNSSWSNSSWSNSSWSNSSWSGGGWG